ncbi:hypothetical protein [[Muricauda] lutisoli]|uniref:Uncharacterized protein n=1 Tax=[Muricauda] lutisoli TaxID=2816035 RepID=A0ABS3ETI4_9FLAO|nr:hypothetical protein [[Muricauda] lutisoli]MBO0329557.1 hypothetical protein [[Muricauda] lutisoli]
MKNLCLILQHFPMNHHHLPFIVLSLFLLTFISCSNDDKPENPVDALPPITQTGENTFACLINGKPFFSSRDRRAFYTYADGAYTLSISGSRYDDIGLRSIHLSGLDIVNGVTEGLHPLKARMSGGYSAEYLIGGGITLDTGTTDDAPGLLTITRFDLQEFIVSGTFEFSVKDKEGNTLNFTDGRFDLKF